MTKAFCPILCWAVLAIGCSNSNEKANELYVEASRLFQSAPSSDDSIGTYKQALQKLETIVEKYPRSDLAVKLVQGETKIGQFTMRGFKEQFLPYYEATIRIEQIGLALDMYAADNGEYPTTEQGLQSLIRQPALPPEPKKWNGPYVKATDWADPWGNGYQYRSPATHEGYDYDLYSYGADGREGAGDDITNWLQD